MTTNRKRVAAALAVGASFLALSAGPALADQAEADAIRAGIQSWLTDKLSYDRGSFEIRGETVVAEDAARPGTYAVTLPSLVLAPKTGGATLGGLTATVRPLGGGRYDAEWRLPEKVEFGGERPVVLTIGEQSSRGVWNARLGNFEEAKSRLGSVAVTGPTGKGKLSVGAVEFAGSSAETAPDRVEIAQSVRLERVAAVGADRTEVGVDGLVAESALRGFDVFAYLEQMKRLVALQEKLEAEAARAAKGDGKAAKGRAADRSPLDAELVGVMDGLYSTMDGVSGSVTLSGVRVAKTAPAGGAPVALTVATAKFGGGVDGLRGDAASVRGHAVVEGLAVSPVPEGVPADLVPTGFAVETGASGLPRKALFDVMARAVAARGPEAEAGVAAALVKAVTEAHSAARIERIEVTAPGYSVSVRGGVAADAASPLNAVGRMSVSVRGGDALQKRLAADPAQKGAAGVVAMANAMGQPGKDGERRYEFELTRDGKVTLNGADFGPMLGLDDGAPAKAAPPAARGDKPEYRRGAKE